MVTDIFIERVVRASSETVSKINRKMQVLEDGLATIHEASKVLRVSLDTIRRWEKKGLIQARRSKQNHRLFSMDELLRIQNKYLGHGVSAEFKVLKSEKTGITAIELFSGCGGMALGFENAGFSTKLLVEKDKDCVKTLRKNRPSWNVIGDDISLVDFVPYSNSVDIVAGGFPCQAFSYAGHSKGFEDTRGTLFFEFARCVNEVRPKIALAENVRGLVEHDGGNTLKTMRRVLEELGYRVSYKLLRAQFLDVPQKRERLFIIGVRDDLKIDPIFPKEKNYTVSLREALKDCPPSVGAKYPQRKKDIMSLVPPGGYWRDLPIDIQKEYMMKSFYLGGGKTGMARRLSWDEPSLTLTCNPAQKQTERCHPEETRPLNVSEYARIQSFPDDWVFEGSVSSQYRQIGNAVPVNLAFHVGRCITAMLEGWFDEKTMVVASKEPVASLEVDISEQLSFAI
jgi:DNA (cytosine-5)-methyltransferase 1